MTLDAILRRAVALRSLRDRAGNRHEAEAAARALAKLLEMHAITEAEIEARGELAAEDAAFDPIPLAVSRAPHPAWQTALALILASHHGVVCYAGHRRRGAEREHVWMLAGRPSDIAVVRHLWAWLSCEAVRLCDRDARDRTETYRDSYRLGFAEGIGQQLAEAQAEVRRASAPTTAALALLDGRLGAARRATEDIFGPVENAPVGASALDVRGLLHGRSGGRTTHLGQKLGV